MGNEHSKGIPGMSHPHPTKLTPEEELFLQAMLWEEGHLIRGPATRAAQQHGLSLLRCLEPANRLTPNLHGEELNKVQQGPSPPAEWPWPGLEGEEVLRLLWKRLAGIKELP
jgi:hypothetical protein